MSQKIIHRLQGKVTEPAINASEVEIELRPDPDNTASEPVVNINTLDFEYLNAQTVNQYIEKGANGQGVGITEGMQYSMSIQDESGELEILDGYLVLTDSSIKFSCDMIKGIPIELRGKNDSLSRRSKTISFQKLFEQGVFTTDDYVQVPYVLNSIPDYKEAAIIGLTAFVVLNEVKRMVQDLLKAVADIAGVLSAIAGVLKIAIIVLSIIVTVALIIIFLLQMLDQLIQPVKYHAGMRWKKLLEIGCEQLGLELQSTIFDDPFIEDTVILPAKREVENGGIQQGQGFFNFNFLGFIFPNYDTSVGYYADSFYSLLEITKLTFRAYIAVTSDNKLVIEKIGTETNQPVFRMNERIKMDEWSTNLDEIIGSYSVSFLTDEQDINTTNNYEGTKTTAITTQLVCNDEKSKLIDGEEERQIPFARATRKKVLTEVEQRFDKLLKSNCETLEGLRKIANSAIARRASVVPNIKKTLKRMKLIGVNIPFDPDSLPPLNIPACDAIEQRIGMMLLTTDYFGVPKVMSLDISNTPRSTNIKTDNESKWHSGYIYNTYHKGQSFAPSDEFPFGNQRREFEAIQAKVCKEDVEKLINNRIIFAPNGSKSELISFRNKAERGVTNIVYRVPYLVTSNLQTEIFTEKAK